MTKGRIEEKKTPDASWQAGPKSRDQRGTAFPFRTRNSLNELIIYMDAEANIFILENIAEFGPLTDSELSMRTGIDLFYFVSSDLKRVPWLGKGGLASCHIDCNGAGNHAPRHPRVAISRYMLAFSA